MDDFEKPSLKSIDGGKKVELKSDAKKIQGPNTSGFLDSGYAGGAYDSEIYYWDESVKKFRTKLRESVFKRVNLPPRFWDIHGPDVPMELRKSLKSWLALWEKNEPPEFGLYFGSESKSGQHNTAEILFAVCLKEIIRRCHSVFCISALDICQFVTSSEKEHSGR